MIRLLPEKASLTHRDPAGTQQLHDDDLMVKKTRGGRARQELGEFYLLNWRINEVTESFVDLEQLGREVRVLADWERWANKSQ